jgi:hypothetical protein
VGQLGKWQLRAAGREWSEGGWTCPRLHAGTAVVGRPRRAGGLTICRRGSGGGGGGGGGRLEVRCDLENGCRVAREEGGMAIVGTVQQHIWTGKTRRLPVAPESTAAGQTLRNPTCKEGRRGPP